MLSGCVRRTLANNRRDFLFAAARSHRIRRGASNRSRTEPNSVVANIYWQFAMLGGRKWLPTGGRLLAEREFASCHLFARTLRSTTKRATYRRAGGCASSAATTNSSPASKLDPTECHSSGSHSRITTCCGGARMQMRAAEVEQIYLAGLIFSLNPLSCHLVASRPEQICLSSANIG